MKILEDIEVDLEKGDLLNTSTYANVLTELIRQHRDNRPMTIGLFGEWGSGKSSIIDSVKNKLSRHQQDKTKVIVYDAWKYANDSFRRMFLKKLVDELGIIAPEKMSAMYSSQNKEKVSYTISWLVLFVSVFAITVFYCAYYFQWIEIQDKLDFSGPAILTAINLLVLMFTNFIRQKKTTLAQPFLFAPEQFEECFNEILNLVLKEIKEPWYTFRKSKQPKYKKVVIVIDNIDRCPKDTAYDMLTNTKNFISAGSNVIFLIPVDDVALKKHIFRNDSSEKKESEEFLRKYFTVTVRIKPYKPSEIFEFAQAINHKEGFNFRSDTINIIAREYASNPRRIKQFFNNLQVETALMVSRCNEEFVDKYQEGICKFLIIREEWPAYHQLISADTNIFFDHTKADFADLRIADVHPGLVQFLEQTEVTTRNLDTETLQKILVNETGRTIPEKILELINEEDKEDFQNRLSETKISYEAILNHLLNELKKASRSGLYKTDVPEILDKIYILMMWNPKLDNIHYSQLETDIKPYIENIPLNSKSYERLNTFNVTLIKRKKTFLDKAIQSSFAIENPFGPGVSEEGKMLFESYLFNGVPIQLENLGPLLLHQTSLNGNLDYIIDKLNPEQMQALLTQETLKSLINSGTDIIWQDEAMGRNMKLIAIKIKDSGMFMHLLSERIGSDLERTMDEAGFLQFFMEVTGLLTNWTQNRDFTFQIDKITNAVFKTKKIRQRNELEIDFMTNLYPELLDLPYRYLFRTYSMTGGSPESFEKISYFSAITDQRHYLQELLAFIEQTDQPLLLIPIKELILRFEMITPVINRIILSICYLEIEGKPLFSNSEINSIQELIRLMIKLKPELALMEILHLSAWYRRDIHVKSLPQPPLLLPKQAKRSYVSNPEVITTKQSSASKKVTEKKKSYKSPIPQKLPFRYTKDGETEPITPIFLSFPQEIKDICNHGSAGDIHERLQTITLLLSNDRYQKVMLELILKIRSIYLKDAQKLKDFIGSKEANISYVLWLEKQSVRTFLESKIKTLKSLEIDQYLRPPERKPISYQERTRPKK